MSHVIKLPNLFTDLKKKNEVCDELQSLNLWVVSKIFLDVQVFKCAIFLKRLP